MLTHNVQKSASHPFLIFSPQSFFYHDFSAASMGTHSHTHTNTHTHARTHSIDTRPHTFCLINQEDKPQLTSETQTASQSTVFFVYRLSHFLSFLSSLALSVPRDPLVIPWNWSQFPFQSHLNSMTVSVFQYIQCFQTCWQKHSFAPDQHYSISTSVCVRVWTCGRACSFLCLHVIVYFIVFLFFMTQDALTSETT